MIRKGILLLLLAVVVGAGGCSQSLYNQGLRSLEERRFDSAIHLMYQEIAAHPDNFRAWRELGVAFFEQGDLTKAEDALKQSLEMQPDARTMLYLGMVHEANDNLAEAIKAYSMSLGSRPRGETARMVRARRESLVSKQIAVEAQTAIKNEAGIDVREIPEHTIAVAGFNGSNLPDDLAPLALGMSDFTASDLSKVAQLTVVERRRLDAVLQELELGRSGYVDPPSAPRVGRLMGSRRLVTGTILSDGQEGLILDGAVVETDDGSTTLTQTSSGKLDEVFRIQKRFVFELLDTLGIKLTAAERDEISEVPTESFLAFLSYCRGLDYERRGMPQAAKTEFAQAVSHDPGFQVAEQGVTRTNTTLRGGHAGAGTLEQFVGAVQDNHRRTESRRGLGSRLGILANNQGLLPTMDGTEAPIIVPPLIGGGTGVVVVRGTIND